MYLLIFDALEKSEWGGSICGEMNICSKFVHCLFETVDLSIYIHWVITQLISVKSEGSAKRSTVKLNTLVSIQ